MKQILFLLIMALSFDSSAQVAKCRNAIVVLSSAGNGSITATGINNGSTGYVSLWVSPSTFNCSSVGPNVVTLTATAANGNTSTCTGTATVKDLTKPLAKCKTASVNLSGDSTLSYLVVDNGSADACGILSYTLSPNTFNCSNIGANSVTLSVKDVNNNVSTCASTIWITCN